MWYLFAFGLQGGPLGWWMRDLLQIRWLCQICLSWRYFWLLWAQRGSQGWHMSKAPPHEGEGITQIRKTLHLMVLSGLLPYSPTKKDGWAKSSYLHGIFDSFGPLKGAPWVMDGWYAIPGGIRGRTIWKDLMFDGLRGLFPSLIQAFHFRGVKGGQQGKQTARQTNRDRHIDRQIDR